MRRYGEIYRFSILLFHKNLQGNQTYIIWIFSETFPVTTHYGWSVSDPRAEWLLCNQSYLSAYCGWYLPDHIDKMNAPRLHLSHTRDIHIHDDVTKWKHFPRYWPFARRIHRSPVNSPHKGQWRGALMFSLICAWINVRVNNGKAGDMRRHRAIMTSLYFFR